MNNQLVKRRPRCCTELHDCSFSLNDEDGQYVHGATYTAILANELCSVTICK